MVLSPLLRCSAWLSARSVLLNFHWDSFWLFACWQTLCMYNTICLSFWKLLGLWKVVSVTMHVAWIGCLSGQLVEPLVVMESLEWNKTYNSTFNIQTIFTEQMVLASTWAVLCAQKTLILFSVWKALLLVVLLKSLELLWWLLWSDIGTTGLISYLQRSLYHLIDMNVLTFERTLKSMLLER